MFPYIPTLTFTIDNLLNAIFKASVINLVPIPESYGGHSEAAPYALITAFQLGLPLQDINPRGDVNNDEQFNISDVIIVVNYIMNSTELDNYSTWASDMNSDDILDILDIIELINNILNQN